MRIIYDKDDLVEVRLGNDEEMTPLHIESVEQIMDDGILYNVIDPKDGNRFPLTIPNVSVLDFVLAHNDKQLLEPLKDNMGLNLILQIASSIQYGKEKDYGSSWCTRGEYRGIMPNIDRKYDRLDNMTRGEIEGTRNSLAHIEDTMGTEPFPLGESKVDAVMDLAIYCMLYMVYIARNYPIVFDSWMSSNLSEEDYSKYREMTAGIF